MKTTRNLTLKKAFYFLPSAGLFYLNRSLYYWILKDTSTGALAVLLQLRIPFTALMHHFFIKKQTSCMAWLSLLLVFLGVIMSQLDSNLELRNPIVPIIATVICLSSALASILNELLLKFLEMEFWDQQLRMSFFGSFFSSIILWFPNSFYINADSVTPGTTIAVMGCVLLGSVSSLFTGFLVFKLDNIAKVISNSAITVMVTLLGFLIFGVFTFKMENFIVGMLMVLAGSCLYTIRSKSGPETLPQLDLKKIFWADSSYFFNTSRLTKVLISLAFGLCVTWLIVTFFFLPTGSSDLQFSVDAIKNDEIDFIEIENQSNTNPM